MKRTDRVRKYFGGLIVLVATFCLVYAIGIVPFYEIRKKEVMKDLYEDITQIDLAHLDEEDQEDIEEYQKERFDILIVDEDYQEIYSRFKYRSDSYIQKHVTDQIDSFQEKMHIDCMKQEARDRLILKCKLVQNGRSFYLYIKKDVEIGKEIVTITLFWFGVFLAVLLFFVWQMMKKIVLEEQQRERKSDYILEKNQKEFVRNVTHELKTPLAVISSQVEILQMKGNRIDKDYYFSSIQEELTKMSQMVGDLLDVTMIDSKLSSMRMEKVNLTEMLEYLLLRYDALFKNSQIQLKHTVEEGCMTWGSRTYIERAVNNYFMNAFQHTEHGKVIEICMKQIGDKIRIEIFNEGKWMSEEQKDHIWDCYYTAENEEDDQNSEITHTGIGLYMVKKIIEKHNGTCGAENVDNGVTFWMVLPKAKSKRINDSLTERNK